jgi:hypothetical protein
MINLFNMMTVLSFLGQLKPDCSLPCRRLPVPEPNGPRDTFPVVSLGISRELLDQAKAGSPRLSISCTAVRGTASRLHPPAAQPRPSLAARIEDILRATLRNHSTM